MVIKQTLVIYDSVFQLYGPHAERGMTSDNSLIYMTSAGPDRNDVKNKLLKMASANPIGVRSSNLS